MPNREHRRAAEKNGVELPIITIKFFSNGQLVIDKHGDITDAQVNAFIKSVAEKLPGAD